MLILRLTKIALVAAVCLWGVLSAFGNLLDWGGTLAAVGAVSAMSGWEGGADDWRATSHPVVITAAAVFIVLFKAKSALLCGIGGWQMWRERGASAQRFDRARALALAGCGVAVLGLFLGWIVLGEQWFEMWRSPQLGPAGEAAFRYAGFIGLIALFLASREE